MARLIPYINFVDKSEEAVTFYKTVFGGDAEIQKDGARVGHFEFRAGEIYFMGADHDRSQTGLGPAQGYSVVLDCDSEQQLRDFYDGLSRDGEGRLAPSDSGCGAVIAQCTDRFGVSWLLNYDRAEGE